MKKLFAFPVLVLFLLTLSCGGGGSSSGGGGTASNPDAPVLLSITVTPNKVPAGSIQSVSSIFTFTDRNGDLGGGTINNTYIDGKTESDPIPASFTGITNGGGTGGGVMQVNQEKGTFLIPVWLTDKAGNKSNVINVEWTQT